MKLALWTQTLENYGAHTWDGTGDCPQYWKAKGGETFVVAGLSVADALDAQQIVNQIRSLVEQDSEYFREYIIDWSILDDDAQVGEEWESPTFLARKDGEWIAERVTINGEYGYMRPEIHSKIERWTMLAGGARSDYQHAYAMVNGLVFTHDELNEFYDSRSAA